MTRPRVHSTCSNGSAKGQGELRTYTWKYTQSALKVCGFHSGAPACRGDSNTSAWQIRGWCTVRCPTDPFPAAPGRGGHPPSAARDPAGVTQHPEPAPLSAPAQSRLTVTRRPKVPGLFEKGPRQGGIGPPRATSWGRAGKAGLRRDGIGQPGVTSGRAGNPWAIEVGDWSARGDVIGRARATAAL